MILCALVLSNKSLMEEAKKCLFRTNRQPAASNAQTKPRASQGH